MYSVALRLRNVKCGSVQKPLRLSGDPVMKLSMPTTSHPRANRNSHRWDPMNPAAPVTRIRIALRHRSGGSAAEDGLAADRVVLESQAPHPLGFPQVAAVEDHRPPHGGPQPLEVQELELVPLGDQRDRVGAGRPPRRRIAVRHAGGQRRARVGHGHRVVGPHDGAGLQQPLDDLDRLGLAHVVGVGLEGQAEHGHDLAVERPQRLVDHGHEVAGPLAIDVDHRRSRSRSRSRASAAVCTSESVSFGKHEPP